MDLEESEARGLSPFAIRRDGFDGSKPETPAVIEELQRAGRAMGRGRFISPLRNPIHVG